MRKIIVKGAYFCVWACVAIAAGAVLTMFARSAGWLPIWGGDHGRKIYGKYPFSRFGFDVRRCSSRTYAEHRFVWWVQFLNPKNNKWSTS